MKKDPVTIGFIVTFLVLISLKIVNDHSREATVSNDITSLQGKTTTQNSEIKELRVSVSELKNKVIELKQLVEKYKVKKENEK